MEKIKYITCSDVYAEIPGSPIDYWISNEIIVAFNSKPSLSSIASPKVGLQTSNNERFIRLWFEILFNKMGIGFSSGEDTVGSGKKWFPHNKGGEYRKWYGNNDNVVDYENNGQNIKEEKARNLSLGLIEKKNSQCWNSDYYFKESLTWSRISSNRLGIRYSPKGFVFDTAGTAVFSDTETLKYLLGFLSTNVVSVILKMLNPTLTFQTGDISKLPVIKCSETLVIKYVNDSINISKSDWDSYETSWDFKKNPLL